MWSCGRRFGKDVLQMRIVAETATKGYPVGFGAPTYKMLTENWRMMSNLVAPITKRRDSQEHRLELEGGGVIDMWSLDRPDAIRGRKYKLFDINEAGFVPNLMDTWDFIVRPTLMDLQGSAIFAGTPKGRNGFFELFNRGKSELDQWSDWSSFHFTSYDNPHMPDSEIKDMEDSMPERVARQEVYAEFIEDSGAVFRRITDCATAVAQDSGTGTTVGVDWGKHNDFTVITVLDADGKMVAMDRFNQIDYAVQLGRLESVVSRYKPTKIIAETNAMGDPLVEQLQRRGLPVEGFTTTNQSKTDALEALVLAFEKGEIEILPDEVLINELQAFEVERLPSGKFRYQAPSGLHDDCVMSLALAWYGLKSGPTWWI